MQAGTQAGMKADTQPDRLPSEPSGKHTRSYTPAIARQKSHEQGLLVIRVWFAWR